MNDLELMHAAARVLRRMGYGAALERLDGLTLLAQGTAWGFRRGISPAGTALRVATIIELLRRSHIAMAFLLVAFSIPEDSLSVSLVTFAQQAGLEFMMDARELECRSAAGVHGEVEADEALNLLLASSGCASRIDGRVIHLLCSEPARGCVS